jgi:hypothetical protein
MKELENLQADGEWTKKFQANDGWMTFRVFQSRNRRNYKRMMNG